MTRMPTRLTDRPQLITAALWIALFALAGIANVAIEWAETAREGELFHYVGAVIDQASSIAMSLLLLPWLLIACDRWPLRLENWPSRLLLYLLGSLCWTLIHVFGMVALRKIIHAGLGQSYDYGPWLASLLYEYGKDVQTFFLIVTVAHGFAWYARQRQGEAHVLSAPDAGVPSVPEAALGKPLRFVVRKLGREFLIATDDIEWLQASGNYVNLHLAKQVYPLRSTIGGVEAQLDAAHFVRVHRSHIVNLRFIQSIEPTDSGDARIHMKDGASIPCSRRYRSALRQEISANAAP